MYRYGHIIYGVPLLISGTVLVLALPLDVAMSINIALFGFGFTGLMRWQKESKKLLDRIIREGQSAQREGLSASCNPYQTDTEADFHGHWNAGWKYQRYLREETASIPQSRSIVSGARDE